MLSCAAISFGYKGGVKKMLFFENVVVSSRTGWLLGFVTTIIRVTLCDGQIRPTSKEGTTRGAGSATSIETWLSVSTPHITSLRCIETLNRPQPGGWIRI